MPSSRSEPEADNLLTDPLRLPFGAGLTELLAAIDARQERIRALRPLSPAEAARLQWEATLHPVLFAAVLHRRFIAVHPFVDGNGRAARLLLNLALLRRGHVATIIPPVARGVYCPPGSRPSRNAA